MYAVIETGGKQYRVAPGEQVKVDRLSVDAGATVTFDRVLAVHDGQALKIGTPAVSGASVEATLIRTGKANKVIVFYKRRRKHSQTKNGHRQQYSIVKIGKISA